MSSEGASLRGRIGAAALHSRYDSKAITAPARRAFLDRFEREVRTEAKEHGEALTDAEVARRAEHRKHQYMLALSLRSAKARRKQRGGQQ